ncbi:YqiA/YcfP family alpha/beta fold hydrolase [Rheinheimera sp. F8]|uniref:YqiA/YcfP family alpha/beta fold hydrolase n=1 Tax=Rheinheimera sp. F8 TaxID=1763998 RepID=UPI000B038B9C|nr:YqiA/YcfP family alpha/beta fold hydrolase [Rheinheimera sp. F8]
MTSQHIVYLHGFASSSLSEKALLVRDYFQQHLPQHQLSIPDLPYTPAEAWQELQLLCVQKPPQLIIGSSLGGFLATALAEQYGCRAVLINPAVRPHLLLQQHLGRYYHPVRQQHYEVRADHLPLLEELQVQQLRRPAQYLVLLQSGDEVLDYRQALDFYQQCQTDVQEGGDHSYQNLQSRLADIVNFGQLA